MNGDLRFLLVFGLPVLAALAGGLLFTRAKPRLLRGIGLAAALLALVIPALMYAVGVGTLLADNGGGFADLVVALAALLLSVLVSISLLPPVSILLPPRKAWIVPGALNLLLIVATHLLTQGNRPLGEQTWTGVLSLLGLSFVSLAVAWCAYFWRNPRYRPVPAAVSEAASEAEQATDAPAGPPAE